MGQKLRAIIDTHSLVDFAKSEGSYNEVEIIMNELKVGNIEIGISNITIAELSYIIENVETLNCLLADIKASPIFKVPLTEKMATAGGELKKKYRISIADAIIASSAILSDSDYVISSDPDMKKITEIKVASPKEFLKETKK